MIIIEYQNYFHFNICYFVKSSFLVDGSKFLLWNSVNYIRKLFLVKLIHVFLSNNLTLWHWNSYSWLFSIVLKFTETLTKAGNEHDNRQKNDETDFTTIWQPVSCPFNCRVFHTLIHFLFSHKYPKMWIEYEYNDYK